MIWTLSPFDLRSIFFEGDLDEEEDSTAAEHTNDTEKEDSQSMQESS